jgi:SAM-dependent methyltransferase
MPLPFVVLLTICAVFVIVQHWANRHFAPWVPSSMKLLDQALSWIKPSDGQTFIDLGCGDGRAVRLASQNFRLRATGVDINPLLTLIARIILTLHRQHARIITGDLYQQDLSQIDIVYIYGLPEHIAKRLNKKLDQELRPGAWIISYNFSLPDRQPVHTISDRWRKIMVYRV